MIDTTITPDSSSRDSSARRASISIGFFQIVSVIVLSLLLLGFGPSLFLRAFSDQAPMPGRLHVHGGIMSLWLLWFLIQAFLVAIRRTDLHRRFGVAGVIVGIAVIPAGLLASMGPVEELRAADFFVNTDRVFNGWTILWGNLMMLVAFSALFTLGVRMRQKTDNHRRLMLLATISILPPATVRMDYLPLLDQIGGIGLVILINGALLAALTLFDLKHRSRIHPVTAYGGLIVAFSTVAPFGAGNWGVTQDWMLRLIS